jgi:hypothetical protein
MVRSAHPWSLALLLACAGCGGRVELEQPAQERPDAAPSLPPPVDAGVPWPASDAEGPPSDPMAACAIDRDVVRVDIAGGPGPLEAGSWTFTNDDSRWSLQLEPSLKVIASQAGGENVDLDFSSPTAPAMGTYTLGSGARAPALDLTLGGRGCRLSNGGFTIWRLQASADDTGVDEVRSLALTFEADCGSGETTRIRGCVRFEQ